MNPLEQLKSVLCDPKGKCCIAGSNEDPAIVDRALQALAEQEPVAWMISWNGQATGNLFLHEQDAAIEMQRLNLLYPSDRRGLVPLTSPLAQRKPLPTFTTGHCKEKAKVGGCQLHNIQCGFPTCDRKES